MGDFLWTFAVEEMLKKVLKVAREQTGLAWGFQETSLQAPKMATQG